MNEIRTDTTAPSPYTFTNGIWDSSWIPYEETGKGKTFKSVEDFIRYMNKMTMDDL